jgi:hypothetical protein
MKGQMFAKIFEKRLIVIVGTYLALVSPVFSANDMTEESLFDMHAIMTDPLDIKVLGSTEKSGVIIEKLEFNGDTHNGKPVRIYGVLGYPKDAKKVPAIFWSQSGMYPADEYMPVFYGKRGYACMCVTLPHSIWNPNVPFDTKNPRDANLTHYAIVQMRAITLLASVPQVDPDRIGVGGSSYGGFFSSLIAGADPRIKAGVSFFAGGNHRLGTNLPQFTGLSSAEDIAVWDSTIDPALRLRHRNIPFIWGVASNDNWFYFPAVIKTFADFCGEKRLVIAPMWEHGFPENIDEELFSWFDIYLKKTRAPYNQPSALSMTSRRGKLVATWSWTGDNRITKADLIVSYGKVLPWRWWTFRNQIVFPAIIRGNTAVTEIPAPEPHLEMIVYGNIMDERGVVISTLPRTIIPKDFGILTPTTKKTFNCFPFPEFSDETLINMRRLGISYGEGDKEVTRNRRQSIKITSSETGNKQACLRFKLLGVPEHSHVLRLWLRADRKAKIRIEVTGVMPRNASSSVVSILRGVAEPSSMKAPSYGQDFLAGPSWKEVQLSCPFKGEPIEGYELTISCPIPGTTAWIEGISFEPIWRKF